jgi:predicted flap endonuclease-1-like 5' DNA nuclease
MGVFDLIRSLLGRDGSDNADDTSGTEVSVEYEPDTESEAENDAGATAEKSDEAVASGTDAAASTGSMVQAGEETETAAEPAEAGAGFTEHSGTEKSAAEPAEAAGPVSEEPEASDAIPEDSEESKTGETDGESPSDPVETISGIGPAYAERLATADVETVDQLLAADAESLAEQTDISEKRIRRWQENASDA